MDQREYSKTAGLNRTESPTVTERGVKRRRLVQGMGLSLAAVAVLPSAGAAGGTSPFDPTDVDQIDEYLTWYHALPNTKRRRVAWERLDSPQQRAFLERYVDRIEVTSEGLPAGADPVEDVITAEDEGLSQDGVTTQGTPVFYDDAVTAYFEGQRLYTYEHEIRWDIHLSYDTYTFTLSSARGDANPDQNIEHVGFAGKSSEFHDTFFDYLRKGRFDNTELPVSYVAHLELRGRADGSGSTIYKDDGFPIEGM